MIGFFRFVLVVLLLVIVAMTSAIVTMHFAIHGAEVAIPDFRGMTMPDAVQRAESAKVSLQVQNRLYSTDVPAGRIANQSPAAGTLVRRGWRVWLTQSLGPQKLAIPNVTGKDQRFAMIAIRRAGFQMGSIAQMPWPNTPQGTVIAQTPQPNAAGVESPVMNLLVSSTDNAPAPQDAWVMPSLEGQIFTSAAYTLTRMGLQLAPVKEESAPVMAPGTPGSGVPMAPMVPPGTVVGQNPPAGSRVDRSTSIELTVAK